MNTRASLATAHAVLLVFAICPPAFSQDHGTSVWERLSVVHSESPGDVDGAETGLWDLRFNDALVSRDEGDDDSSTGPGITTDAGQSITTTNGWQLYFGPYLWMASYYGATTIDGMRSSTSESFKDIVEKTDFSFMWRSELMKDDWGVLFNAAVFRFEDDFVVPGIGEFDVTFYQAMVELQVAHRFLRVPFSSENGGDGLQLWGTFGNRYWHFEGEIEGPGAFPDVKSQLNWLDPIVGVIVRIDISPSFSFVTLADFGGFNIGSRYSTHFTGVAAYELSSLFGWGFSLVLYGGYTLIDVKYVSPGGQTELDYQMRGPNFGLRISF